MKIARLLLLFAAAGAIQAQTWDTSGNSLLNGTYYFRQVIYVPYTSSPSYLLEAVAFYGSITFNGNGNYTASGQLLDYSFYYGEAENYGTYPSTGTVSGTYSISSSGYGFISSPYVTGDTIYGLVSAQSVFVGSATDNNNGYNDMLVMARVASPLPTVGSFTGSWSCADFDFSSGNAEYALSSLINLSPDGNGNLNAGTINGYEGVATTLITQSSSGLKYTFSNGAAVAAFPTSANLVVGQKYLYFSADGNFVFGGGPITSATPFDMIVGVKTSAGTPTLSGLYYQAGLDEVEGNLDSYFGSLYVAPGAAPQAVLGHQRTNYLGGAADSSIGGIVYDYTYDDTISLTGDAYTNTVARYIVGDGGAIQITSGVGPFLGLSVALQQPTITPTTTVFLDPTRIQNSASNAPFTASIAPGELLTMYGSNLASTTQVTTGGLPFPTSLANVQVNIGGYPAPIYYVSPGQISAIVPYEVTPGSIVQIQLINNMGSSNVVTQYVAATAPGVFTQNEEGTGYGDVVHLGIGNSAAAPYSLVSDANPAIEGETLAVYLTGLGSVTPSITDGAVAPADATTTNTITVDFSGTAVTNDFSGLAPGLTGLYQLNITLPTTGLTAGPNYLDIAGPDSYMSYLLVPVSTSTSTTTSSSESPNVRSADTTMPPKFHRPPKGTPSIRRQN
jgi:uncharacterized protein (TIGR03437 family)